MEIIVYENYCIYENGYSKNVFLKLARDGYMLAMI